MAQPILEEPFHRFDRTGKLHWRAITPALDRVSPRFPSSECCHRFPNSPLLGLLRAEGRTR